MKDATACSTFDSVLPWYVNGRLPEAERAALDAHLGECPACRAALADEQQLARTLGDTGSVELAPQAAMRRFFERLDTGASAPPVAPPRRRRAGVALLFAAQACLVLGTGVWLGAHLHAPTHAPAYVTESAPPVRDGVARMRIVVDPKTSLADFEALLRRLDARVVAGPTEARVYTLALPAGSAPDAVQARVVLARQEPAVTFAEPVAAGAP